MPEDAVIGKTLGLCAAAGLDPGRAGRIAAACLDLPRGGTIGTLTALLP
jgi:hypothetical protein